MPGKIIMEQKSQCNPLLTILFARVTVYKSLLSEAQCMLIDKQQYKSYS